MVPRDSIQAMHFSEDFHAELFAAEPDVMSPVEMAFDENGKVYVAEMMDYPEDPPAGKPARSRIRVLDNPNGDGKTWRSSIFAENVLAVSGFMPWKGGLIVTSAPDILFLKDTDGDGKADLRQVLYTGFPKVNQEARITNPRLGVDNWIYCSNTGSDGRITSPGHPEMQPVLVRGTDFRFDPISGRAEAASGPAQFGSTMDDFDHRFITQNTTHIRHVVVPMKYVARAPLLEVRAVAQDISDHGRPSAPMYPLTGPQRWRKQRTALRQQRYNENKVNVTEQLSGWFTAASGGTIYNGDAFPKQYAGSVFTGDVSGNLIHRDIVRPDGATFAAQRAMEKVEFLASTDVWFRPCNFTNAPDGNLYVTDIYRQVIETPESIPEEIRRKIDFFKGDTLGRIYRIVPNHPLRQGNLKPNLGAASSAELVNQLANPNGWHRQTAHRLLLERQDASVIPALRTMAGSGTTPEARVHALWLLRAANALQASDVELATKDADSRIREHALELSESFLGQSPQLAQRLIALAADPDAHVRFQAALTLGEWKDPRALGALAEEAHRDSRGPVVPHRDSEFGGGRRGAVLSHGAGEGRELDGPAAADRGLGDDRRAAESGGDRAVVCGTAQTHATGKIPGRADARPATGARAEPAGSRRRPDVRPAAGFEQRGGAARGVGIFAALRAGRADAAGAAGRALDGFAGCRPRARGAGAARRKFRWRGAGARDRAALASAAGGGSVRRGCAGGIRRARGGKADSGQLARLRPGRTPARRERDAGAAQSHSAAAQGGGGRPGGALRAGRIGAIASLRRPDAAISTKARTLLENANSNRAQVVASYRDVVNLKGDVAHGKIVFQENCARCHEPRRQAGRIGPDLSGINNKTKEELITSILNPSYAIEPRFVNYVITTKDGRMYDGIIANETTWSITLRGGSEEGDETVLRKNIASIRASSVSLMPDELEKGFGKQGLADVIAYLRGGL